MIFRMKAWNASQEINRSGGRGGLRQASLSMAGIGLSLLPVALAGCLLLSFGVSLAVPMLRCTSESPMMWLAAWLYLLSFGVLGWMIRKVPAERECRLVWGLILFSAAIKLILAGMVIHLPLHADQALFHHFVTEMSDHRLEGETLAALSRIYDYPVWAGRVLPVHYLVRHFAAAHDVFWVRLLNVGLSTAILAVSYGFASRLLPKGRRKWVVFLLMALPFQSFVTTDYSHHLFSSFYFLVFAWCAWEMLFTELRLVRRLLISVLGGICLLLMMWQRGVHLIALGIAVCMLAWAVMTGAGWRRWGLLLLCMLLIPLSFSVPLSAAYDRWLNSHDAHQLNSILPAFTARGWCPESGGEYCGRYEQLDRVTPWPLKKAAMNRLVLSQIRHNPAIVCGRFPILKTAKLFLVGYASNLEEGLAREQSALLPWVKGARVAATPVFLLLAVLGCLGLAARSGASVQWGPIFLVPLFTWGAYVFLGETSPRYSIFCQPFLGFIGGWALAQMSEKGPMGWAPPVRAWKSIIGRGALVAGALACAMGLLVLWVRQIPESRLYANLQEGWNDAGAVEDGEYRPFEVRLPVSLRPAVWTSPSFMETGGRLSFYLLDADGSAANARLTVSASGQLLDTLEISDLTLPHYVELDLPPAVADLSFEVKPLPDALPAGGDIQVGYVSFLQTEAHP